MLKVAYFVSCVAVCAGLATVSTAAMVVFCIIAPIGMEFINAD